MTITDSAIIGIASIERTGRKVRAAVGGDIAVSVGGYGQGQVQETASS